MATTASSGVFDLVLGLPLHPLVVHAAVVLVPLGSLAVIALYLIPRWRRPLAWPTLAILIVAALSALISKESGEALATRIGVPDNHAQSGAVLPYIALTLCVIGGAWLVWVRRSAKPSGGVRLLGALSALVAIAAIAATVLTGHSGAQAAWSDVIAGASSSTTSPAGEPTGRAETTATASNTEAAYTMAQVAEHADSTSCWSVVDGQVYDLTTWIPQHPGGEQRILDLCGKDGSGSFDTKHGNDTGPKARLASYRIGTLTS